MRPLARQGSGKAAPVSAAQRKLAKNKSRSTAPLTLSALRTLGVGWGWGGVAGCDE